MSPIQLLVTFAELSVAYVGFASIIAAVHSLGGRKWSSQDRMVFRALIEISLVGVLLGLIPVTLSSAQVGASATWVVSSVIAIIVAIQANVRRLIQARSVLGEQPKIGIMVALPMAILAIGLNIANIALWRAATPYVFTLLIIVLLASAMFLNLVFRLFPLSERDSKAEGET